MLNPEEIERPFRCQEIVLRGQKLWIPFLDVESGGVDFRLHWGNTTVRTFADEEYDHIELRDGDTKKGIQFDEDMMDLFIEYDYPRRFDPLVDDSTLSWYGDVQLSHFDQELEEFLDEP